MRNNDCLACHLSWETLGVPGLTVQSMYPIPDEISYANGFTTIHGSPLEQRWGGWFVTGDHGGAKHMGNVTVMPADKGKLKLANPTRVLNSVEGLFDLKGYPDSIQRRRRAAGARASDADDQPDHAHRMGSAAARRQAEHRCVSARRRGRARSG